MHAVSAIARYVALFLAAALLLVAVSLPPRN